jgi:hypothetical protein
MNTAETTLYKAAAKLDRRVSARLTSRFRRLMPEVLIRRALIEAREAAQETGWPLLAFPILAEELVARVAAAASPDNIPLAIAA